MRSWCLRLSLLVALLSMSGVHWGVLQSVAWISMTTEYASTLGLADAVDKTLSGEAPCGLCRFIQQSQPEPASGPVVHPESRWDFVHNAYHLGILPLLIEPDRLPDLPSLPPLVTLPEVPPPERA